MNESILYFLKVFPFAFGVNKFLKINEHKLVCGILDYPTLMSLDLLSAFSHLTSAKFPAEFSWHSVLTLGIKILLYFCLVPSEFVLWLV